MSESIEAKDVQDTPPQSTTSDSAGTSDPVAAPPQGPSARHPLAVALSWLPPLVVATALASIAWYGHQHDWRLPAASVAAESGVVWCDSHSVPEEECIVCLPALIEEVPKLKFCKEHGVHGCVLCNPQLAESKRPVSPTEADLDRAARALALRPRTENLAISSSPGSRIQFASIDAMRKAGVDVELVERDHVTEAISAAGEIRYDETKSAQVSPRADGIVQRVSAEIGDWVKRGDVLALIDSTEAGRLKTELLAALAEERLRQAEVDRLKPLAGQAVAGKRLLESQNAVQQSRAEVDRAASALSNLGISVDLDKLRLMTPADARSHIRRLGLAEVALDDINDQANEKNLVVVVAPITGQIVDRTATLGRVVDRGSELFRIVDTRTMWLDLRVPAEEASLVKLGLAAKFLPDGDRQPRVGTVTWISSDVDAETRTVRVRADLANEDGHLRNEAFGQGQIVLRDEPDAIVVPETALQWDGAGQVVFVRDARFFEQDRPKFFVSRSVRTGVRDGDLVEVIAGVLPGEVVATSGSDVLRAQLLKSNLGAGCTCGQ